jgi:hypothetical protein
MGICPHDFAQWQWQALRETYELTCLACHAVLAGCTDAYDVAPSVGVQPILRRPKMWGEYHIGEPDFEPPMYTQNEYDCAWRNWEVRMPQ